MLTQQQNLRSQLLEDGSQQGERGLSTGKKKMTDEG